MLKFKIIFWLTNNYKQLKYINLCVISKAKKPNIATWPYRKIKTFKKKKKIENQTTIKAFSDLQYYVQYSNDILLCSDYL